MRLSDGNVSRTMRTLNEYMYDSANCRPSLWHEQAQWLVEMVGHKVAGGEWWCYQRKQLANARLGERDPVR